jgi:hypothetical protein
MLQLELVLMKAGMIRKNGTLLQNGCRPILYHIRVCHVWFPAVYFVMVLARIPL